MGIYRDVMGTLVRVLAADNIDNSTKQAYYATTMPNPPVWVKGAKQTLKLGRHVFFKDVP